MEESKSAFIRKVNRVANMLDEASNEYNKSYIIIAMDADDTTFIVNGSRQTLVASLAAFINSPNTHELYVDAVMVASYEDK